MNTTNSTLLADVAACREVVEDYTKRLDDACVEYYTTGKVNFPSLSRADDEDTSTHCYRVLPRLVATIPDALTRWEGIKYPSDQYDQMVERARDFWVRRRNLLRVFEKTLRTTMEVNQVSSPAELQSAWASGSFYLVAVITLVLVIRVAFGKISPFWLPVTLLFGLLGATLVGAFQLAHDKALSETGFLQLMRMVFKNLPLIRSLLPQQKEKQGVAPRARNPAPDEDKQR